MSLSSTTNRQVYQGNGTSAVFSFAFELHAQGDLQVFTYNSSSTTPGLILNKILNTDYTFSGVANASGIYPNGGNIIFNSSPNVQTQIILFRSSAVTNDFFVGQNGAIPSTSLNNVLNRMTLLQQRAQDLETRSVRLHDGYPLSFDPTLPSNIADSAGKRLIVNSSATGFTFDETLASYIPNTLAYANTNSSVTSLGGARLGLPLISQGSSAPLWQALDVGSGQVIGTLRTDNGGTGVNGPFPQFAVIVASSTTQFGYAQASPPGSLLTANSGALPTFQTFSANNINSGILQTAFGGTGTGSTWTQGRMVFVGSGLVLSETEELAWDDTLKRQTILGEERISSLLPNAVVYTNASSVLTASGVLQVNLGGTGLSSGSSIMDAFLPTQTSQSGKFLTTNGTTTNWASPAGALLQSTSVVTTAVIGINEDIIYLKNLSGYSITAPNAVGNAGKIQRYVHAGSSWITGQGFNSVIINGTSGQLIGDNSTAFRLWTPKESVTLASDGVNWKILDHYSETPWILVGSLVVTGQTTNPAKAATPLVDQVWVKRSGSRATIQWKYSQLAAGSAGSGAYFLNMPTGMQIDSGVTTYSSSAVNTDYRRSPAMVIGYGHANDTGGSQYQLTFWNYDTNRLTGTIFTLFTGATNWDSANGLLVGANIGWNFWVDVPISQWEA